jgi:chaperonin GroES
MQFRPLHDRVVVRRLAAEERTAGGIIIPDTAKEKPVEGEVLAVGPGARDEAGRLAPLDVAPGDRVLFAKYGGTEVKIQGEEVVILRETDILGVIAPASAAKAGGGAKHKSKTKTKTRRAA